MTLYPGGRVAGSDPGLVTLLTAGDGVISDQCPWSCTMLSRHPAPALHRRRAEPLLPPASITCAARSPVLLSHAYITCTLLVIILVILSMTQHRVVNAKVGLTCFLPLQKFVICGQMSYQSVMPQQSLWWMRVGSK